MILSLSEPPSLIVSKMKRGISRETLGSRVTETRSESKKKCRQEE